MARGRGGQMEGLVGCHRWPSGMVDGFIGRHMVYRCAVTFGFRVLMAKNKGD